MSELHENVIEWFDDDDTISVTLHQKRFVNKIERLSLQEENVVILARNDDGSIFAHLPISMLKLGLKRTCNKTVSEKSEWAERMKNLRQQKKQENEVEDE